MSRIIKGQIIATTGLDRHGDRIPEVAIRNFYESISDATPLGMNHDLSQPPVALMFNKRLETLPSGELAITADVEVLDEERFSQMGGVSIAYTRTTIRYGDGSPSFRVLINPDHFDFRSAALTLREAVPPSVTFDVTERIEKAAFTETALIVVLVYVVTQIADGFFRAIGAELFQKLKSLIRKDVPDAPCSLQIHLKFVINSHNTIVVLTPTVDTEWTFSSNIDVATVIEKVRLLPDSEALVRIVGKFTNSGGVTLDTAIYLARRINKLDIQIRGLIDR